MDWIEYKSLCERPDYFSRFALAMTQPCLSDAATSGYIDLLLGSPPIAKPEGHKGGPETDHFIVELDVRSALRVVLDIEAGRDATMATGRQLAHLGMVWRAYAKLLMPP